MDKLSVPNIDTYMVSNTGRRSPEDEIARLGLTYWNLRTCILLFACPATDSNDRLLSYIRNKSNQNSQSIWTFCSPYVWFSKMLECFSNDCLLTFVAFVGNTASIGDFNNKIRRSRRWILYTALICCIWTRRSIVRSAIR